MSEETLLCTEGALVTLKVLTPDGRLPSSTSAGPMADHPVRAKVFKQPTIPYAIPGSPPGGDAQTQEEKGAEVRGRAPDDPRTLSESPGVLTPRPLPWKPEDYGPGGCASACWLGTQDPPWKCPLATTQTGTGQSPTCRSQVELCLEGAERPELPGQVGTKPAPARASA